MCEGRCVVLQRQFEQLTWIDDPLSNQMRFSPSSRLSFEKVKTRVIRNSSTSQRSEALSFD